MTVQYIIGQLGQVQASDWANELGSVSVCPSLITLSWYCRLYVVCAMPGGFLSIAGVSILEPGNHIIPDITSQTDWVQQARPSVIPNITLPDLMFSG